MNLAEEACTTYPIIIETSFWFLGNRSRIFWCYWYGIHSQLFMSLKQLKMWCSDEYLISKQVVDSFMIALPPVTTAFAQQTASGWALTEMGRLWKSLCQILVVQCSLDSRGHPLLWQPCMNTTMGFVLHCNRCTNRVYWASEELASMCSQDIGPIPVEKENPWTQVCDMP